ncbi:serine-rich adhesin for platelets-like [Montipora capricornis]|uniref:serine-rich adhesin for platelets-like n=1 Tax=Montipora foliosa TaxID=591990 RepID=UPI0035F1D699
MPPPHTPSKSQTPTYSQLKTKSRQQRADAEAALEQTPLSAKEKTKRPRSGLSTAKKVAKKQKPLPPISDSDSDGEEISLSETSETSISSSAKRKLPTIEEQEDVYSQLESLEIDKQIHGNSTYDNKWYALNVTDKLNFQMSLVNELISEIDQQREDEVLRSDNEYDTAASVNTMGDVCARTDTLSLIDSAIANITQDVTMTPVNSIDDPKNIPPTTSHNTTYNTSVSKTTSDPKGKHPLSSTSATNHTNNKRKQTRSPSSDSSSSSSSQSSYARGETESVESSELEETYQNSPVQVEHDIDKMSNVSARVVLLVSFNVNSFDYLSVKGNIEPVAKYLKVKTRGMGKYEMAVPIAKELLSKGHVVPKDPTKTLN